MDGWEWGINSSGGAIVQQKCHKNLVAFQWQNESACDKHQKRTRSQFQLQVNDANGDCREKKLLHSKNAERTLGI